MIKRRHFLSFTIVMLVLTLAHTTIFAASPSEPTRQPKLLYLDGKLNDNFIGLRLYLSNGEVLTQPGAVQAFLNKHTYVQKKSSGYVFTMEYELHKGQMGDDWGTLHKISGDNTLLKDPQYDVATKPVTIRFSGERTFGNQSKLSVEPPQISMSWNWYYGCSHPERKHQDARCKFNHHEWKCKPQLEPTYDPNHLYPSEYIGNSNISLLCEIEKSGKWDVHATKLDYDKGNGHFVFEIQGVEHGR